MGYRDRVKNSRRINLHEMCDVDHFLQKERVAESTSPRSLDEMDFIKVCEVFSEFKGTFIL